jgi:hypothetical protein
MAISVLIISHINWSHKGYKLARDNPVKVSVLNFFIMLVFFDVEGLKVVPITFDCFLQTLKTVKDCAFIITLTLACIAVG